LGQRTWVLLTETPEGGWGLWGKAHTNADLVQAARADVVVVNSLALGREDLDPNNSYRRRDGVPAASLVAITGAEEPLRRPEQHESVPSDKRTDALKVRVLPVVGLAGLPKQVGRALSTGARSCSPASRPTQDFVSDTIRRECSPTNRQSSSQSLGGRGATQVGVASLSGDHHHDVDDGVLTRCRARQRSAERDAFQRCCAPSREPKRCQRPGAGHDRQLHTRLSGTPRPSRPESLRLPSVSRRGLERL
jgi:hypothetical protein